MNCNLLRQSFLDFFESKLHKIVPSAPMVIKDDPTLMFTNAGMNQFKDIFLGNTEIKYPRIADSQKCLRVSGKHNDLEEVGHDTYHHTMFEMLGNWSFGDYFKKDAINWAWEYLIDILNIDKNRIYATVFEGSAEENIEPDNEAKTLWKQYLPDDRILYGNKKDNFWEMGDTGPCGPCSEIHIDLRTDNEIAQLPGRELVNKSNPLVIEIWNLVFIQFNRKKDNTLELLPAKHVDTGMGFERLCMVVQNKKSNYDTDIFQPIIKTIAEITHNNYGENHKNDIAMRVIADHLRTVAFAIADGRLPSNEKAGYVIRRILRRAVRYGYTFLLQKNPFIYKLLPTLINVMGEAYPELVKQELTISRVIEEEEDSFLKTLDKGIRRLDKVMTKALENNKPKISGEIVFELYDTFGFPNDLTDLILKEHNLTYEYQEFDAELKKQKQRSREDAKDTKTDEWTFINEETEETNEFTGYDNITEEVVITRYRKVESKNEYCYHLVFNKTPFYAESGGQAGDIGEIQNNDEKINITDTKKEHSVSIHIVKELPINLKNTFTAVVDKKQRLLTMRNHSATHLLHNVLRKILGTHVEQKGSQVTSEKFRFDFAHFQEINDQQLKTIEDKVNEAIKSDLKKVEKREIPIAEAKELGAIATFGEKYGENVRVIAFDDSLELCGGTHVERTSEIGLFKIISERAVASGVRRIEAVTSLAAEQLFFQQFEEIQLIKNELKTNAPIDAVKSLLTEKENLEKKISKLKEEILSFKRKELSTKFKTLNGINCLTEIVDVDGLEALKNLVWDLRKIANNTIIVLASKIDNKSQLIVGVTDDLKQKYPANMLIKQLETEIGGKGGGQQQLAMAGGGNVDGIQNALNKLEGLLK